MGSATAGMLLEPKPGGRESDASSLRRLAGRELSSVVPEGTNNDFRLYLVLVVDISVG